MALYELSLENSSTEIVEKQVQAIMKLLNNSKDYVAKIIADNIVG